MSADLETRLWRQLEQAAAREARRGRGARAVAGVRARLRIPRIAPAIAVSLAVAALLGVVAVNALDGTTPAIRPPARPPAFHVAAGLDRGVVAGGSVWLHDTSTGALLRTDPRSGAVVARTRLRGFTGQVSLAAGDDAVWVVPTPFQTHSAPERIGRPLPLTRVDARTGAITATVALRAPGGEPFVPFGVVVRAGRVWVWGPAGALRIDPATGTAAGTLAVPGDALIGFGASGADAWAVTGGGRLVRFDARTGARLGAARAEPADTPFELLVTPGAVALGDPSGAVTGHDPGTGRLLWRTPVGSAMLAAAAAGDRIWVAVRGGNGAHDTLLALDAASGRIARRVTLPGAGVGSVVPVGDSIWVAMSGGDVVVVHP